MAHLVNLGKELSERFGRIIEDAKHEGTGVFSQVCGNCNAIGNYQLPISTQSYRAAMTHSSSPVKRATSSTKAVRKTVNSDDEDPESFFRAN